MLENANDRHRNIKLTSTIDNPTSFLDVQIKNIGANLITSVYHKEAAEPYVLPFQSDHPRHVFVNIIDCSFLRALRYSSTLEEFNHEHRAIKLMLLCNGFVFDSSISFFRIIEIHYFVFSSYSIRQVTLVRGLAQLFLVEGMLSDVTFLMRYCVYKFIFSLDKIFLHK